MQQAVRQISNEQVRTLYPLGRLSQDDTEELLRSAITVKLSAGSPVFGPNDPPKQIFYLLAGEIELFTTEKRRSLIRSGTAEAKKPLGRGITGQYAAVAHSDALLISFDGDMLELFLSWSTPEAYLVNEMSGSRNSEWLDRLLQSRGLLRFSEEQIETLLSRMNEVHFNRGDTVIRQGGLDEYYYIIKNGRCSVTRNPGNGTAKVIKLAELRQGDAFGEEALLANAPRNANIVMEEEGALMRLSKADFSQLLAEPLLSSVRWEECQTMVRNGAVFLDIRLPDEFAAQHIPGSVNIPLALLRLRLKQLGQKRKYIICCNDGGRSAIAAFLLNRHGYDAFILDGGLNAAQALLENIPAPEAKPANDQWNTAVEDLINATFEDAPGIDTRHKTRTMAAAAQPAAKVETVRVTATPRSAPRLDVDFILQRDSERQRRSRLARIVTSAIVIALVIAISAIL